MNREEEISEIRDSINSDTYRIDLRNRLHQIVSILSDIDKELSSIDPAVKSQYIEDLIPCMFCRQPSASLVDLGNSRFRVACRCGAQTGVYPKRTIAIAKWNNVYNYQQGE